MHLRVLYHWLLREYRYFSPNARDVAFYVSRPHVYIKNKHTHHIMLREQLQRNTDGALIEPNTQRRVFLRGANVPAKLPPFQHDLSPEALCNLRSVFGFTTIRLVVTWEAIEPEELQYNAQYMEYILDTVRACALQGLSVIIDPHQDCWSRWTGGDGAPRWTMEKLGIVLDNLAPCCATHPHPHGHPLLWSTNYQLFASATMFTLFFGSERFAKHVLTDEGLSAQVWLQTRFTAAFASLAAMLKGERNVLGFGTLNEPSLGWIGHKDLCRMGTSRRFGYGLSPLQCIRLAAGESLCGIVHYGRPYLPTDFHTLNPGHARLMTHGKKDIWPHDIQPDHFTLEDQTEDAEALFLHPFWKRFGCQIREAGGDNLLIFTEVFPTTDGTGIKTKPPPVRPLYEIRTPHYYDSAIMGLQRYLPWLAFDDTTGWPSIGTKAAAKTRSRNVTALKRQGGVALGEVGACWLGESTNAAFDATFRAVESNLIQAAFVWCYIPKHVIDDGWNGENFSIWSQNNPRIQAAIRPYALCVAGIPLRMEYIGRHFILQFKDLGCAETTTLETVLFVTHKEHSITVSDGTYDESIECNLVRYKHDPTHKGAVHTVNVWYQMP